MPAPKPPCVTIARWLQENLGKRCLAPLTSTDVKALQAAVQIVDLWSYDRSDEVAKAFGDVVSRMQPQCRHLAFHAIAHIMDWSHRLELWHWAGLELPPNLTRCTHEPQ